MTTKTDTKTSSLIINELTKEQYKEALDQGEIREDELYLVSGEEYTKSEIDKLVQDTKDELQFEIDSKPNNTDVVHKDGSENILGQKTFRNKLSNTYEPNDKSIYSDGLYVNTELVGGSLAISNVGNDTSSTSTRECDLIIDRDNCASDSNTRNQVKFQISSDGSFKFAHTRKARHATTVAKEDSQMGFNAEGAYWFGSGTKGSPVADAQYKYPILHTGNLAQINLENYCKGASQPINNPSDPTGNTIKTTAKTLFGAINELYDSIQSGGKSYEAGEGIDITDNTISVDEELRNTISDNTNNISNLDEKIKEMELFKSPNAIIVGDPTINNGQITNLSKTNYLILPFQFDPKDRAFELTYCFRTRDDVTTPQNLYGSKFSIASYVSGGKLTIRVSGNGTSWNVLDLTTNLDVQPNTTYYIKLIFNRLNYTVKASTDGVEYSQIGYVVNTGVPFAGDVYVGIGNNQNNPFLGTINFNKWELKYNNSVFWEGMDDAGLNTRADISLSNLDEEGQGKFDAKQDVIEDLDTIRSNAQDGKDIIPQVEVNTQRIEELTTAKLPNVVIKGTPHIVGGQVSGFSNANYLQFPFTDISHGRPFRILFSFTTGTNVTRQQNILDSHFGLALAIQNGKGVMALSSNGSNWDIGSVTGTNTLSPNTTYYAEYAFTGTEYTTALSLNKESYVPDMRLSSTKTIFVTTTYIGGSPDLFGTGTAHPFEGSINFYESKVEVQTEQGWLTVWEGMAEVGLASRANVSLNNLDEVGQAKFDAKQDALGFAPAKESDLTTHTSNTTIHVTASDKIAWSQKQNTSDNSLTTTNKTIVGAINEVKSSIPSLSGYATESYVQTYHDTSKQDVLVPGTNIKTINNESILGSGNITIQGGGGGSYTAGDGILIENNVISVDGVETNEVTLSSVATSGNYNDLSNKPTVDQTYNPTSTNAQSGVAIAGVLGNIETLLSQI